MCKQNHFSRTTNNNYYYYYRVHYLRCRRIHIHIIYKHECYTI